MKIDFSKPRIESKTFQNRNLNFQTLGTSESLADRISAVFTVRRVQNKIWHIAGLIPKLEKKELKEGKVAETLDIEGKVFKNLIPAMEEVIFCYENTAQVMSDLVDKILPQILKMKFLPSDKQIKPQHHLKLRTVRSGVVTIENMTRKLGVNESILRRGHVRKEIRIAMRSVYKIAGKLKNFDAVLRTKLPDAKYKELLQKLQVSQRAMKSRIDDKQFIKENPQLVRVFKEEEFIAMRFVEALAKITQEYDDIAFMEADVERIIKRLADLGYEAANPNKPLLPPADLGKFINLLEERTKLFQRWVNAARIDQNPFQKQLSEAKNIFQGDKARFGGYWAMLYRLTDFTERWCNLAFRDQEAIWQKLEKDLKEIEQLRYMLG